MGKPTGEGAVLRACFSGNFAGDSNDNNIYIYYIYTHTYMIPNFGGDTLRYNDTQLESNVV